MSRILNTASSALGAFGVGMQVTANNVANVNTDGFHASQVRYQEAPNGMGVQVGEISESSSSCPVVRDTVDISALAAQEASEQAALEAVDAYRAQEMREASNVQIEREMVNQIILENAHNANTAVVTTYDDMMGTVIDMVV